MASAAKVSLAQFERLEIDVPNFHHRDHIEIAYENIEQIRIH